MNVGILSESAVDEVGVRLIAEAVLGTSIVALPNPARLRTRGWTAVIDKLPSFYKALHWRPDATGVIAVLDSDETVVHDVSHETDGFKVQGCRCCQLHRIIHRAQDEVGLRQDGTSLKLAIGLAVPAIEAWYHCGEDNHNTEARYSRESHGALRELRRELKRKCYGAVSVPQERMVQKTMECCTRLRDRVDALERLFPSGFGLFARSLRAW